MISPCINCVHKNECEQEEFMCETYYDYYMYEYGTDEEPEEENDDNVRNGDSA